MFNPIPGLAHNAVNDNVKCKNNKLLRYLCCCCRCLIRSK